jgi:hypothetical protein
MAQGGLHGSCSHHYILLKASIARPTKGKFNTTSMLTVSRPEGRLSFPPVPVPTARASYSNRDSRPTRQVEPRHSYVHQSGVWWLIAACVPHVTPGVLHRNKRCTIPLSSNINDAPSSLIHVIHCSRSVLAFVSHIAIPPVRLWNLDTTICSSRYCCHAASQSLAHCPLWSFLLVF